MLGAIAGDIIGSVYESRPIKTVDFPLFGPGSRFTDDTVLTIGVGKAILEENDYARAIQEMGRKYPDAGYGPSFLRWLDSDNPRAYGSWGNGAAMRISPVGLAFDSEEKVLQEAKQAAEVSHDHPEGIKGARAIALGVYLARHGRDKGFIKRDLSERFGYDLERKLEDIRPDYGFDMSCQGSVPEAVICFLQAGSYEEAVRNAVSLGGDSDTLACMAGGIAEAFFGPLPENIRNEVEKRLPRELWKVVEKFYSRFGLDLQKEQ